MPGPMPELPEVETVRRGLEPVLGGALIVRTEVRRPDLRWPFPERLAERLTGARVNALRRRSKYILADLDTDETLLIHLGMSGRMTVSVPDTGPLIPGVFVRGHPPQEKHDHVVLHTDGGGRITFNDARRFGAMDLFPTACSHPLLDVLGVEPLGNAFDGPMLIAAFKGRNTPVKAALLDQRIVAGLGNIYVCESLWRTGIHPACRTGRIGRARVESLVAAIRAVLSEAIDVGGSSLRDHRQTSGDIGYFQHSLAAYDRENQPCKAPGCSGTIKRILQSGRSSFFCPICQR